MSDTPGRPFSADDRAGPGEEEGWGSPVPAEYGSLRSVRSAAPAAERQPDEPAPPRRQDGHRAQNGQSERRGVTSILRRLQDVGEALMPSASPAPATANGSAPEQAPAGHTPNPVRPAPDGARRAADAFRPAGSSGYTADPVLPTAGGSRRDAEGVRPTADGARHDAEAVRPTPDGAAVRPGGQPDGASPTTDPARPAADPARPGPEASRPRPDPLLPPGPAPAGMEPTAAVPTVGWDTGIDPADLGPTLSAPEMTLGPSRRRRARRPTRVRTRATIRHLDIMTVIRVSVLFWAVVLITLVVASVLLWTFADAFGTLPSIQKSVRTLFSLKSFQLHPGTIAMYTAAAGVVIAVVGTLASIVLALIYNLIADVVGGIRVELETFTAE